MLPVLAVTIDGIARARRQGHSISRWAGWVLASALPFVLTVLLVLIARATDWITAAPPAPVAPVRPVPAPAANGAVKGPGKGDGDEDWWTE